MRHLQLPPTSSALPCSPLPAPRSLPLLGLGTWRFGEASTTPAAEVAPLRTAFELGCRFIDAAEMYDEGGAE